MIASLAAFRALTGDALIALGDWIGGGSPNFDGWTSTDHLLGGMESDGPDLTKPAPIPLSEVRSAVADLPDSQLLRVAATVIEGWTPLLLAVTRDATDADVLVETLRDRAAQFEAVETDVERPIHAHPCADLLRSVQSRTE